MNNNKKVLIDIFLNNNLRNIKFKHLYNALIYLGFKNRIKGDHYIFYKEGINEIINLQPDNNMAKPYQIKQVKILLVKYNLLGDIFK